MLFAGIFLGFSYPPYELLLFCPFALIISYKILSNVRPLHAIWYGALFGNGFHGVGLHWLFVIINKVDDGNSYALAAILLGVIVYASILFALMAFVYTFFLKFLRSNTQNTNGNVILFALVWLIFEWLSNWLFSGFPYFQLAYVFYMTPLIAYVPVIGTLGLSFIVALLSAFFAECIDNKNKKNYYKFITVLSFILTIGFIFQNVQWTKPKEEALTVRLITGALENDDKFKRYRVIKTIDKYLDISEAKPNVDLVVWHETAIAYTFNTMHQFLRERAKILSDSGTEILLGSYLQFYDETYDAVFLASNPKKHYLKRQLIPFAEYPPAWINGLGLEKKLPNINMDTLKSGASKQVKLKIKDVPIALSICYEIFFSDVLRKDWEETELLIHLSDIAWFKHPWLNAHLLRVAQYRALESGKPLLMATNFGSSAYISHVGEIVDKTTQELIDVKVTPRIGITPYTRFGNYFLFTLIFFLFTLCLVSRK